MSKIKAEGLEKYAKDVFSHDRCFGLTKIWEPRVEHLSYLSLALSGEVGEFCNVVKKILRDGEKPELWQAFDEELVDILIYYIEILNCADVDFDAVWKEKHEVLFERYRKRFNGEKAPAIAFSRSLDLSRRK